MTNPIPGAGEVRAAAEVAATVVADRCHGDRPKGSAPQRYAIIWQAARSGVIEHLLPSTGVPCELCGKSVRLGHYVNSYDDIGEARVDCDSPDALPSAATPCPADDGSFMPTYRMVGSPLLLERVADAFPAQACPLDGKPCCNPECRPGYCFSDSAGRNPATDDPPDHMGFDDEPCSGGMPR